MTTIRAGHLAAAPRMDIGGGPDEHQTTRQFRLIDYAARTGNVGDRWVRMAVWVGRPGRPGIDPGDPRGTGRGNQLDRYRGRLRPRTLRGDRGPGARGRPPKAVRVHEVQHGLERRSADQSQFEGRVRPPR